MNKYLSLHYKKISPTNIENKAFYNTRQNKENNNPVNYTKLTNVRHFPPAVREWNNSVYTFNKSSSSNSTIKYNQLDGLIKNYFNLANNVKLARSKRMRYLRRKTRSRKVYLSKPEIRQNNDKISITVYCFDRNKQIMVKKLFFFNKSILSGKVIDISQKKKYLSKKLLTSIRKKYRIPFSGVRYINELKNFRNKNIIRNKMLEQSILFQFFKYILSVFGIQIFIPIFSSFVLRKRNKNNNIYYSKRKLKKINQVKLMDIVKHNPSTLYWINYNTNDIEKIEKNYIKYNFLLKKLAQERKFNKKPLNSDYINSLTLEINGKLWIAIKKFILNNKIINITMLKIFNKLSYKLSKLSIRNLYKKRARKIPKLINFIQNNFLVYKKLLPTLKKLIDNLYNKKTELNIVNLKYSYLNSDILTQILISKIQKRISTMKILRRCLKRIKPTASLSAKRKVNTFSNLGFLSLNSSLSLNTLSRNNLFIDNRANDKQLYNNNWLNSIFNQLFPKNYIYNDKNTEFSNNGHKIKDVLNNIKYKSLLGVWIQAKGRLTRRNTAARSITHRIHKGDLKDKDQYIFFNKANEVSTVVLRNDMRSNTQYIYKGSFRRIGTFGLKTWISSK